MEAGGAIANREGHGSLAQTGREPRAALSY